MKIKTRRELLKKYKEEYSNYPTDIEEALIYYFKSNNLNYNKAIIKAKDKLLTILKKRKTYNMKIILYEYPMKTDRPRTTKKGTTYSPNAKDNKKYFDMGLKKISKDIKLLNAPASIKIDAYIEMPKGVPPDEILLFEAKILNIIDRPDYDNIGKCYTDIQKDTLIIDDDIFYKGTICKFYSVLPRVEIFIQYQDSHDSNFIYKKIKNRKIVKELLLRNMIEINKLEECN